MNNILMCLRKKQFFILAVLILALVLPLEGCANLRRKFTRKKKKKDAVQDVPIWEPEDYPEKIYSKKDMYEKNYRLWKVWSDELLFDLSRKAGEQRLAYLLRKCITHLEEMASVLTSEKAEKLNGYIRLLREHYTVLSDPAIVRDSAAMRNKIDSLMRRVLRDFKPVQVQEDLI